MKPLNGMPCKATLTHGNLADIFADLVYQALETDGKVFIPQSEVKTVTFQIPIDIHIKKNDGTDIIINREIKGDFEQSNTTMIGGVPVPVGTIHIK